MSPLTKSNNLAARMGRWSAGHWKTAVFGWLAFVALGLAIGMQVGTKQIDMQDANVGQSHKADQILKEGFPQAQADPQKEFALVQSSTRTVNDPAFRATVNDASTGSRRTALRKIWASPSLVTTASNPACSMVLPRIASLPRIST